MIGREAELSWVDLVYIEGFIKINHNAYKMGEAVSDSDTLINKWWQK